MKVYCAGSSKEIPRIERWVARLKDDGIEVVSTWIDVIRSVGATNPKDATIEQYIEWTSKDFAEVRSADVLWLFLPEADTIGAWIELGFAHALGKLIVASGTHRPIFTPALAKHHSHYDAEIAAYLKRLNATNPSPFLPGVTGA